MLDLLDQAGVALEVAPLADIVRAQPPDFASRAQYAAHKRAALDEHLRRRLALLAPDSQGVRSYTELGKPYLVNSSLAINYSHSRSFLALAYSWQRAHLGVDIEDKQRRVDWQGVAEYAFSPEEIATWRSLNHCRDYWLQVWTTKEAVVKAAGLGIRLDLVTLNSGCQPAQMRGHCSHKVLGDFDHITIDSEHWLLSVAWRSS